MNVATRQGQIFHQHSLAEHTTWRVGGLARTVYKPSDVADLVGFLQAHDPQEPLIWLGLGSNSLIKDQGVAGTVVITQGGLNELTRLDEVRVRVEAGVSCAKMARFCAKLGLTGGEFWAGIPGTMGGALRMNAGCFNGETWNHVESVETINRFGIIRRRAAEEFTISYRSVRGLDKDEWFLSANCRMTPGDTDTSLGLIKQLLQHRAQTQPTGEFNCGSVFRNPPNDYAARLIESCGLKGLTLGGAQVSQKHANFIINHEGKACAQDIESLIQLVHDTVEAKTGISMTREVHIIGEL